MQFINELWNLTATMAPYLLFGFFMAGLLSLVLTKSFVKSHLGNGSFTALIKAALIGVPMPLCSCSVIPVTVSLTKQGANKGPAVAFLTSTPQTGIDSIIPTYFLLGPIYALLRVIVAFICGLTTGLAVSLLKSPPQEKEEESTPSCCITESSSPTNKFKQAMKYGLIDMPRDLSKALFFGIIITAIFTSVVPTDFFADSVGSGIEGMLIMLITGIPIYVCATASIPIAVGLIIAGFSPGAVLVFLISGPATNAASISALIKIIGKKETIIYLITLVITALAAGLLIDYFEIASKTKVIAQQAHEHVGTVNHISAVILLSLMSQKLFTLKFRKTKVSKTCCCSGDKK